MPIDRVMYSAKGVLAREPLRRDAYPLPGSDIVQHASTVGRQTKIQLFEILRSLEAVPGVQIETGADGKTPPTMRLPDEDEDMPDVDQRPAGEE